MMPQFEIEPVETLAQWTRAIAVRNRVMFDGPTTPERAMKQALAGPDVPKRRVLLKENDVDRAYAVLIRVFWSDDPNHYSFSIMDDGTPEVAVATIDWAETTIREFNGTDASSWSRSDQPILNDELARRGYVVTQNNPVGKLTLDGFDPARWLQGTPPDYEIVDVATYAARHPNSWKHDFWRLEMDIFADVPMPTPFAEVPLEDWVKEMEATPLRFDWMFFALYEGVPVGVTQLFPNVVDPSIANTGLTGTRREHRRRGLASALKGRALALAKESGIATIYTDNEENNPMYQINVAIGFQPSHALVNYHRKLA